MSAPPTPSVADRPLTARRKIRRTYLLTYWRLRHLNHKRSHAYYRRQGSPFCPGCGGRLNP